MAIHQRDRNFQRIIADIDVNSIPLKFIQEITCFLTDGSEVVIPNSDFLVQHADNLESFIRNTGFYDTLADINIKVDFDKVEADVNVKVSALLDKSK